MRIGRISRLLFPSYGRCYKCKTTWNLVDPHITDDYPYTGSGCFPLCEKCWEELGTFDARRPYYAQLYEDWGRPDEERYKRIIAGLEEESG